MNNEMRSEYPLARPVKPSAQGQIRQAFRYNDRDRDKGKQREEVPEKRKEEPRVMPTKTKIKQKFSRPIKSSNKWKQLKNGKYKDPEEQKPHIPERESGI